MNETMKIIMERDGLTKEEARTLMLECREDLLNRDTEAIND